MSKEPLPSHQTGLLQKRSSGKDTIGSSTQTRIILKCV